MATSLSTFLGRLRLTHQAKEASSLSDAVLLERFVHDRDEIAFEVLVWRHAPLVLGVCRRLLRDEQEMEDVFQATFLVLVRKAGAIGRREVVGSWLYKVAYRVALRCRDRALTRPRCPGSDLDLLAAPPGSDLPVLDRLALDEEISRLPARYRSAVVLCYLEGQTQEAAARQLGCAVSTVAWRLARARQRLQARLGQRGGDELPGAVVVPPALVEITVQGALAAGREVPASVLALAEGALLAMRAGTRRIAAAVLLSVTLLCAGSGLFAWQAPGPKPAARAGPELGADRLSLRLPPEEVTRLGVRVVETRARAVRPRRLELAGSLAIEPTLLKRVSIRFAAEVIELGAARAGDAVKKGQVLAVVSSTDVGLKKSALLDAMLQLAQDEEILARAEKAADAVPEVFLLQSRRNVISDQSAVNRARITLRALGIAEADIKPVEEEAKRILTDKRKRDPKKEKAARATWERVTLRAPFDGVLVERNVALGEVVVDATVSLFKVADLRKLVVLANVSEADLPALLSLQARHRPRPIPWEVRIPAEKDAAPLKSPGLERIGYLIDPKTGTAVVSGQVDNALGILRAGQYVKVTIFLPAPTREIVVPTAALVESAGATCVFVQADPRKMVFTQRRVVVVRRGRDVAHVRIQPGTAKKGVSGLRAGERVVTEGALELQAALDDLREEAP
jgi:cobalt-zinc-cadmium efflux system membrane fusion protein